MSFEEIPHTADVKIRATAPTLGGLFSEVFRALMEVMYGADRTPGIRREIHVESSDPESLLADFLSEALFITEVEGLVFSDADVTIRHCSLDARLDGEPFNPARHSGGTEVKGISYAGLEIVRDTNGYTVDVLFDV